jgi:hypothetical protein
MSASSISFATELEACRARIVPEFGDEHQLPHMLTIIERWKDHPAAEQTWRIIRQKLSEEILPSPKPFIALVLERALIAKEIDRVVDGAPLVKRADRLAEHKWRGGEHQFAAAIKTTVTEHQRISARVLGREKKTASRKLFMLGWSDKFKELCEQPLDEVVRVLTEIAFGTEITIETVRGAQRQSTRAGRRKPRRDTRKPNNPSVSHRD